MRRLFIVFLSVLVMSVALLSAPAVAYANVSISAPASTIRFAKGCRNKIVVYINSNRANANNASFSSSNKKVATVDKNGIVKAISNGQAQITVKSKANKKLKKKIKIIVKSKHFWISPNSAPLNGKYLDYWKYNSKTKNYFTIRSYMEYFEKHPNCSLRLGKGEYRVTNILYVPSNTRIILSDGVYLRKSSKTGNKNTDSSGSMFVLCDTTSAHNTGVYSQYNGVHDVKIVGEGDAKISMYNADKNKIAVSIVMCHNQNVKIKGITFTSLSYGHYIEMDASKNILIENCVFKNYLDSRENSSAECINLDTPDKKTNGFHQNWSSYDKTPNDSVTIKNCEFRNVQRAIGTHQYSKNKYHKNIKIENCVFKKCFYGGVYMMNWKNVSMNNNTFNGIGKDYNGNTLNKKYIKSDRAFLLAGCSKVEIKDNSFKNCYQVGAITSHQSNDYPMIYSTLTDDEIKTIETTNKVGKNINRRFVRAYENWDGLNSPCKDYYIGK